MGKAHRLALQVRRWIVVSGRHPFDEAGFQRLDSLQKELITDEKGL